jgi:hypothetical protein
VRTRVRRGGPKKEEKDHFDDTPTTCINHIKQKNKKKKTTLNNYNANAKKFENAPKNHLCWPAAYPRTRKKPREEKEANL